MSSTGAMPAVPAVVAVVLVYALLFLGAEGLGRRGWSPEATRRLVHIVGALLALPLPWLLGRPLGVALAVALAGLLAVSAHFHVLGSVHDVRRASIGEVVFPLGIALGAVVSGSYPQYALAVLVLALADPAAGIVGANLGHPASWWPVRKSVAGSLAFLVVTLVLAAAFLVGQQPPDPIRLLPSALVVTLVEASLARGLDNLAIPAVTALAFAWMF